MASNKEGIVSGGIGFLSRATVQFLLFGVTIVATRQLSIEEFGSYALASLFLIVARALFYVGPYEYLLKTRLTPTLYATCLRANIILASVISCLLTLVYFVAFRIFDIYDVSRLIALLAPSIFLVAVTAWYEAVLLRDLRVRRYYLSTLIGDCIGAALAVFLLIKGYGVVSLVAQTYARLLILLALYAIGTTQRPTLGRGWVQVRDVFLWSKERYYAVLLNFTSTYGADLVLGILLSPAATGLYRASSRIVSTLTDLFAQPLQKISQTNLSARLVQEKSLGTSWLTMLSGVGAIGWAGLLTLGFLADDLVPLALGEKWTPAVPIVVSFCAIKSFMLLDAVTTSFLVCHDRQKQMLRVQIGVAAAVIGLSWFFAPFGPQNVAIAVGCATATMSLIYGFMVLKLSKAGTEAIFDMVKTSAPPVIGTFLALSFLDQMLPHLSREQAVIWGLFAAAVGSAIGAFIVRTRILTAIGSLGHLPEPKPSRATP
ncbi:MAG: oligosaccharide flippase family protein [Sphingorhabdus sp.]|uniref:oligosaccharide flippase family protein n=1 Tax=Sphingorhabdus sp. TaxID=1902408 RepID=UPI0038FC9B04